MPEAKKTVPKEENKHQEKKSAVEKTDMGSETKEPHVEAADLDSKDAPATAAATGKDTKKPAVKAKKKGKAKRRLVPEGIIYIQATYNNTVVTITDPKGEVIAWSSAGSNGFKGAKKATPYAAQVSSESAANKAKVFGFERGNVIIKGVGSGREQAIRGINSSGISIESIRDVTAVAHNGCRPRKSRRV